MVINDGQFHIVNDYVTQVPIVKLSDLNAITGPLFDALVTPSS